MSYSKDFSKTEAISVGSQVKGVVLRIADPTDLCLVPSVMMLLREAGVYSRPLRHLRIVITRWRCCLLYAMLNSCVVSAQSLLALTKVLCNPASQNGEPIFYGVKCKMNMKPRYLCLILSLRLILVF